MSIIFDVMWFVHINKSNILMGFTLERIAYSFSDLHMYLISIE